MKKLFIILPLFLSGIFFAQKKPVKKSSTTTIQKVNYPDTFKKISDEILLNSNAYEHLRELTKGIGSRFSGTLGYEKATTWAEKKLKEVGADVVWKQDVKVPIWQRGNESLQIKTDNGGWKSIKMLALGNSEGTDGKDLVAEIVLVKDFQEFSSLPIDKVKDKIIFFNFPMDQTIVNTADSYLLAGKYRWSAPSLVGKRGAKAVITRSLTSAFDDIPHTGSMYYDPEDKVKVPALCIGAKSADELEKLLKKQKVQGKLNLTCGVKGETINHNVIGEIPGTKDDKVIVVGAHLDTWDITEGAHDDGAGVVQCLEVIRTFKALGLKNNHTIRIILYANEENGVKGGETYAAYVKKKAEPHIFAIESDAGGFSPRGISLDMYPQWRRKIFEWKSYFLPYGVYDFDQTYAGQDILPLKKLGIPLAELVPDTQRYFDIHHTSEDTFEKVNRRELLLGAVTMAQMVFMVDKNW